MTRRPKAPVTRGSGSRSGTRHTEAERAASYERTERISLRLRPGYKTRLHALAESDGYTIAEWIETWVEMAETEAQRAHKSKKPPHRSEEAKAR